jgi:hypothetical protein
MVCIRIITLKELNDPIYNKRTTKSASGSSKATEESDAVLAQEGS